MGVSLSDFNCGVEGGAIDAERLAEGGWRREMPLRVETCRRSQRLDVAAQLDRELLDPGCWRMLFGGGMLHVVVLSGTRRRQRVSHRRCAGFLYRRALNASATSMTATSAIEPVDR